ncbi:MAG: hypothetical protein AB3N13_13220 [Arenibacterium sp.]
MSLTVHSDPQAPAGGFAFLELPEGSTGDAQVSVAIFDAYGERWLAASEEAGARIGIGNPHWQAEKHEFGPYAVHAHQGALWVRVGPEIVNKLEEYLPLKIEVAGRSYDVVWPDDVPPRAGAAVIGGLRPISRETPVDHTTRLVGKLPNPPEGDPAEPETPVEDDVDNSTAKTVLPPVEEPNTSETSRSGGLLVLLMLILFLSAAGAAAWFFWPEAETGAIAEQEQEPRAQPDPVVAQAPQPVPPGNPCTAEALREVSDGFAGIETALRGCGADVAPDVAFVFVEEFATAGDGRALLLLGTLYDATEEDAEIETEIGLDFEPDDSRAAEYYARARDAGAPAAGARLQATCERLQNDPSTLARGAYDAYCG